MFGGKENEDDEDLSGGEGLDDSNATKKTHNTSNVSDKKFMNKKRGRNDKGKKGKLNMEFEYENKEKDIEHNYNDW